MSIFADVKARVSILDAINLLGLKGKTDGAQYRFKCPNPRCKSDDKHGLSVHLDKGFRCFISNKKGSDCIALAAHVLDLSMTDAAEWLQKQFGGNSAKVPAATREPEGRPDTSTEAVRPLEILGVSDDVAKRLDITEHDGQLLFKMRDDGGIVIAILGVATREDLPLLSWDEVDAPKDAATSLQNLWRVVQGKSPA